MLKLTKGCFENDAHYPSYLKPPNKKQNVALYASDTFESFES